MERFKGKIEGVPVEDELELGTVRGWNGHENEGNIQRIKIASSKLRWHLPKGRQTAVSSFSHPSDSNLIGRLNIREMGKKVSL